jgi:chemotaxis protein CheD
MAERPQQAQGVLHGTKGDRLNLLAGQLYFGAEASHVHTLLGSCVAVTLWQPQRRVGGMCHFLLPSRLRDAGVPLDGRYGDEALDLLVQALRRLGTRPEDYEAQLYGGADTMPDRAGVKLNIGERNIEQGWGLIEQHGFRLMAVDVGDHVPRNVAMDMASGEVTMRRGASISGAGAHGAGAAGLAGASARQFA